MNYKNVWGAAGIALAGATAFGASAQASDLSDHRPVYKDEPVYVAPAPTWAGGYVGGHLGASWTSGSADITNVYHADIEALGVKLYEYDYLTTHGHKDLGDSSFHGGVHLGYNWQAGAFVYGVEGSVSFADEIDYLASVRGRLGVAAGNWLFYGTGGVAFIGTDTTGKITDQYGTGFRYDTSDDQTGYVVGGGVEVKLTNNLSVGVEGLYYGFDGVTKRYAADTKLGTWYDCGLAQVTDNVRGVATAESGADVGVVQARLTYHLAPAYTPLK